MIIFFLVRMGFQFNFNNKPVQASSSSRLYQFQKRALVQSKKNGKKIDVQTVVESMVVGDRAGGSAYKPPAETLLRLSQ